MTTPTLDDLALPADAPAFADLPLPEALHRAAAALGFVEPTAIQADAIPVLLAGRDLVGVRRQAALDAWIQAHCTH